MSNANKVKTLPASADPHVVYQYLQADGVVVVEGAASRENIDTVLEELGIPGAGRSFALAAQSPTFATQLLMHPLYIDLVKRVLTHTYVVYYENVRTVSISDPQVSQTSTVTSAPGSEGWGLRRQDECHHVTHPATRESDFGIAYAATDITKENGAIRVVIGSNNWLDSRDPLEKDETLVEMRKGDALLCLGSTFYGQAPNKTDKANLLLTAFATPGYRRQEENQYLAVPWETARAYPTDVQRFIGYTVSRPYGGSVEHMDPQDYLRVKGDW